ncbi:MAG: hypothetical protein MRY21_02740 [Simkaniaceae bacterium]|nr:hypothetical protein [Simkaniaceae bacterium]
MFRYLILFFAALNAIDVHDFKEKFQLGYLTTEQGHAKAKGLSEIMKRDLDEGLAILHAIDHEILPGYDYFVANYLEEMQAYSGRLVLVGAGSSGRIAIDLAARGENVLGIVAGGDRAFVRAREEFEDSVEHGIAAAKRHGLCEGDTVILISSSGSASFNVGVGRYAHEVGAKCYYFYNSERVPARTQSLFDDYGVIPLLVNIGPPAIRGSTRLQSGTVGLLCLGTLVLHEDPVQVRAELDEMNAQIRARFPEIRNLIEKEVAVLSHPDANFYRLQDENPRGYITFIADSDALREIMIDSSETAPTFSTNVPRTIHEERLKQAEFQAFLCSDENPWEQMLGREVFEEDRALCSELLLGIDGLSRRHTGEGNLVIAVHKGQMSERLKRLVESLPRVETLSVSAKSPLVETIALKQILNMISNSTMILMNKVDGNYMIDMKASNHKLTDRCIRLTQESFARRGIEMNKSYDELFDLIQQVMEVKEAYESERNEYTPSPMKIAVTMLSHKCDAHQAISLLRAVKEDLSAIFSSQRNVIYLDGGGSKIDLYYYDQMGHLERRTVHGGGNLNARAQEVVAADLNALLAELPRSVNVVAGFAGAGSDLNRQAIEKTLHALGFANVSVTHDIGLLLNLVEGNTVVVIAGTGSNCFARKGAEVRAFGGLGRLIGDEGSGYWLGRRAINCALRAEQGWGPETMLLPKLKELYGVDELKQAIHPLHRGEMQFPLAAEVVLQEKEDPVAQAIVKKGAQALRASLDAALAWSGSQQVILQGGLFKSPEYTAALLKELELDVINMSEEGLLLLLN